MAKALRIVGGTVERLPDPRSSCTVTDELNKILVLLREACPRDSAVSFDFDGALHVHIDVRQQEEVTLIKALLPVLGAGMFNIIRLGKTPHRPFFHRISALVAR